MLDFRVGERVKFHPDGSRELLGTLTRYNKKTVTLSRRGSALERVPKPAHRASLRHSNRNSKGAGVARFQTAPLKSRGAKKAVG